ncbi:hypothetical protein ACI8AK_02360 [Geodermatophilus sp. SYSU D00867]
MISMNHFAEPRAPHGGLAGEGALNLLGRPDLDPYVVLVREAVQNSWDARAGDGDVRVSLGLSEVTTEQRLALKDEVFSSLPPKGVFNNVLESGDVELERALKDRGLRMLCITDRGTKGLGGPLRADRPADEGEATNFIDLVFNIGQPSDRELGGGTYGFGKTISYLVSGCRTVLIHTSANYRGRIQQRLIAQTIGRQYDYRRQNYTGRHWWGRFGSDNAVEPVTGDAAKRLADRLGLPAFSAEETGTTIAILAPDLAGREPHQVVNFMIEALLWNFWPKMVARDGSRPAMTFVATLDGEAIPVPDPRQTPPLSAFAQALDSLRACDDEGAAPELYPLQHIRNIKSQRPIANLGWLAMHAVPFATRPILDCGLDDHGQQRTAAPFTGPSHHVAVMRRAELVVQYRSGPALTNKGLEWAGVFRTSEEVDAAFAAAEPPTHDTWNPTLVSERRQRTYVNVALRDIKAAAEDAFAPAVRLGGGEVRESGVVVADQLGQLLSVSAGNGPRAPRTKKTSSSASGGGPTAKAEIRRRWLEPETEGRTRLCIEFAVTPRRGTQATEVMALVAAAGPDGVSREKEAPVGAPVPEVLGYWRDGRPVPDAGEVLQVAADDQGAWCLKVLQPRDVGTVVDLRLEPLGVES